MTSRQNHKAAGLAAERGTVIFDLDGTLVDSAPDLADSLDELLEERGLVPIGLDQTRRLIGHGIPNLVRSGLAARGQDISVEELAAATSRFQQFYAKRLPARAVAYPGARECLNALKADGWRLVVCTNKFESFARSLLKGLNLEHFFDVIAGPDTFGVAKPDPRHLRRALPEHHAPGYTAIMVGDSEVDIETAKAAGIPVIAVTFGYAKTPLETLQPQALANSFSEVSFWVRQLSNNSGARACAP